MVADKQLNLLTRSVESEIRRLTLTNTTAIPFPAERKLLATLFNVINSFRGGRKRADIPEGALTWPVQDYMRFLEIIAVDESINPGRVGRLASLVTLLETHILQGDIRFEGDRPAQFMQYSLPDGQKLHVRGASSIVKSLAGLDVYMRHNSRSGDLLIIDEPEMNAHPEAQLAIAELLATIVNNGVRVLITTHSPYIVDHLKNLVEAAELRDDNQTQISEKFVLRNKGAFIKADKLAVYLFGNGEVKPIFDKENRLIDWSTFGDTSEKVTNLYADLLDIKRSE